MGWNPYKRRSEGRIAQLNAVRPTKGATHVQEKENRPITHFFPSPPATLTQTPRHISNATITSEDRVLASRLRAERFECELHNERRKSARAKKKVDRLWTELQECRSNIFTMEGNARTSDLWLQQELARTRDALSKSEAMVNKIKQPLSQAQARITALTRTRDRLSKRITRLPEKVKHSLEKPCALKENGIFTEEARTMTRELVKVGVLMQQVGSAVKAVVQGFGVNVKGCISARSVGCITLEGGLAAQLQIVHEIEHAPALTLSGDGTTHKNINYESRHIALQTPDYGEPTSTSSRDPSIRFVGISSALNHTSQEQLNGWKSIIDESYKLWNSSPTGSQQSADFRMFFLRALAMITDHANDQKKLKQLFQELKIHYDREIRGERALLLLSPDELLRLLCELNAKKFKDAGGHDAWEQLSTEEQDRRNKLVAQELVQKFGKEAYDQLSPGQKLEADFFIWAGCCMHKDLNAHKGGNARLVLFWAKNGLVGPILLMNKDNAAAATSGSGTARKHAEDVSSAGAVKLLSLLGALLNHKDKKKGQQDFVAIFFESILGYIIHFVNTSNTCYQSYSEGAAEVIVHLPIYIQLLEFIRNKKDSRSFNYMESNIWQALHNILTLTELCVLALYGQVITYPYMREVRGTQWQHSNGLNLGPLHERVKAHCRRLIAEPELLYGPEAAHEKGSMDGKVWDRPEAIYAIQALAPSLPHLRGTLVEFLEGALKTWERFSSEYEAGGEIANASAVERQRAWVPTTNDHNEGALGAMRVVKRKAPNMTLETHNARKMYKHNNTRAFMDAVLSAPEDQRFLRSTACIVNREGHEKKRREVQVTAAREIVDVKLQGDRDKAEKKAEYTKNVRATSRRAQNSEENEELKR